MNYIIQQLEPVYGKETAEQIAHNVIEYSHNFRTLDTQSDNPYWYKYLNLYTTYPDAFHHRGSPPLQRIKDYLPTISDLGCNCLHILPFLDSPLIDKGFDISDYYRVRKDLGTIQDVREIMLAADDLGIRVFMDLVFNHVSDEHEWFQKAENGDEEYREYFLYSKEKPTFIRKYHKGTKVYAEYELENGKKKELFIVFPENVGDIPHWRQGKDGYWYYHTFYPEQLDVNWFNPTVFLEYAKILMFWASFGFHFRLDAILFIGYEAYKNVEKGNELTHRLIAALSHIAQQVNPECAFIVETYESMASIRRYFGTTNRSEAHLAYNFHLSTHIWISVVKKDTAYIWKILHQAALIPKHAEWVNFLRNHDELSLDHISDDLQQDMRDALMQYGAPFREGHGVCGRTYALLGSNEKRFLMTYFLLASLPGGIGVIYGDEYAMANTPVNKLSKQEQKDMRNVNRGKIAMSQITSNKSKRVFETLSKILKERNLLKEYMNVSPEQLESLKHDPEAFGAVYTLGISKLYVFVNLTSKKKVVPVNIYGGRVVRRINGAYATRKKITLPAYAGLWIQV